MSNINMSAKLVDLAEKANLEIDMRWFPWDNCECIPEKKVLKEGSCSIGSKTFFRYRKLHRTAKTNVSGFTVSKNYIALHLKKTMWIFNVRGFHKDNARLKYCLKNEKTEYGYTHKEMKQILLEAANDKRW